MYKFLAALLLLNISSAYAVDCIEHSFDANWPEDKILKVISCQQVHSDKDYFRDDQLCLSLKKDQSSDFATQTYNISLATDGSNYPIGLLGVTVENGRPTYGDISIGRNGDAKLSGTFQTNNWKVRAEVNLDNPENLHLTVKGKGFGFLKTKHKATYKCDIN